MRNSIIIFLFCLSLFPLVAQDFFKTTTDHVKIYSTIDSEDSAELSFRMETLYSYYQETLDLSNPPDNLIIYRFEDLTQYQDYLIQNWGLDEEDFLLLDKGFLSQRRLLIYGDIEKPEFSTQLNYLLMTLMLESTREDLPNWLKIALSSYFEHTEIQADNIQNSGREKLQQWLESLPPDYQWSNPRDLLSLEPEVFIKKNSLKGECWLLITFLLETDKPNFSRLLWDSLNVLDSSQDQWPNEEMISDDFIEKFREFPDLLLSQYKSLTELKLLYENQNYPEALELLEELKLQNIPQAWYYQGLIEYHLGDWDKAILTMEKAISKGAPQLQCRYIKALCFWQMDDIQSSTDELIWVNKIQSDMIPQELRHLVD